MHNNTVCKINLTVFGLSCVQKPLKNKTSVQVTPFIFDMLQ